MIVTNGTTTNKSRPSALTWDWHPFPTSLIPDPVGGWIKSTARAIGCDPSMLALPTLAALGACVGTKRRLRLKSTWAEFPIFWLAVVAESGTMKSPAFRAALAILLHFQSEAIERYQAAREDYDRAKQQHDAEMADWLRSGRKAGQPEPEAPTEPTAARYVVADVTVERVAELLRENPAGLLMARDELAAFFKAFDAYRNGRGGDAAKWLELFSAGTLTVDRKTGDNRLIHVPRAAASITGTIQPGTLAKCLDSESFDSGMAARFLFAAPPRAVKQWTDDELDPAADQAVFNVFRYLLAMQHTIGPDGQPRPVDIPLSADGRKAWLGFYKSHNEEAAALTGDLAAAWAKLEAYAARFSLLFHLVREAGGDPALNPDEVDARSVGPAVAIVQWFGHETRRLYATMRETAEQRHIRSIIELARRNGGEITVRDLSRTSLAASADDARSELLGLQGIGVGVMVRETPPQGGRPREVFRLHPDYLDEESLSRLLDSLPNGNEQGFCQLSDTSNSRAKNG